MVLEVSSRVIEEDGRPIGVQGICRDITARKQAEIELRRLSELNRHLSLHDGLTGLPNRASFREQVEQAIGVADARRLRARRAADGPRSLQGDQRHARPPLRRPAAGRAGAAARVGRCATGDTVARLGGDEFGVLVPDVCDVGRARSSTCSSASSARSSSRSWSTACRSYVEASIGVARYPGARRRRRSAAATCRRRDVRRQGRGRAARRLHRRARPPRHRAA